MRIGIDLGGTKIETIALDARNGKELYRLRVPTHRDNGCEGVLAQLVGLVRQCEKTFGQTSRAWRQFRHTWRRLVMGQGSGRVVTQPLKR